MSDWETVGSLIESHRAKSSHPDRRNFMPQPGRHPSVAQFSGRLPQLQSTVPNSPPAVPNFLTPVPIFLATLPNAKSHRPHFSDGRPRFPDHFPQFFRLAPHFPEGFPQFPGRVPQFFYRRPHFQWPVPQQFMLNYRQKSQKAQRQTLTRPAGHPLPSDGRGTG